MIGSMYSGISGLKANTTAMEVIGDNIANVGTTGFKASRISFANVFNSTMTTSIPQTGCGAALQSVEAQWQSGGLESTNSATDFAVNGTGLFVVNEPSTGTSYYTRAGQFDWDKDGNLVTTDGHIVQGYTIDSDGTVGFMDNITLPLDTNDPEATDEISFGMNLDSDADVGDTFTSSITTYNSLGSEVILDVVFSRQVYTCHDGTDREGWIWSVNTDPETATCTNGGFLCYDNDGNLETDYCYHSAQQITDGDADGVYDTPALNATNNGNPVITVGNLDGADDLDIDWIYLDDNGDTDGSITGYSSESAKTAQSQNGVPSGSLQTVSVDEDGYFTGIYSNGSLVPFAQIALADFPSYSGLSNMGGNLYAESLSSGEPLVGVPNTSSLGSIAPSTLEMSNVDLTEEFVEMITTQRSYQANSKVITTSDELLNELINIKR